MPRCRFVQPDVVRIELSDGDWIDVKKRLTVGDELESFQRLVGKVYPDGSREPNLLMMGIAEALTYIVEWSFVDPHGHRVPVSADALRKLPRIELDEVDAAIAAHVKALSEEDEARKNARGGGSETKRTSLSVVS